MNRLQFETAVANQGGAMEADAISKNGRNPKSQTSRTNNLLMFFCTTFLVVLISAIMLSGCKKNKDNDDNDGISTSDFINIEGATYKTENMPTGSASIISDISIGNQTVINGGSTIISFTTSEAITAAYISIKGMPGYFEYTFTSKSLKAAYTYEIVLLILQTLTSSEEFSISISVANSAGKISATITTETVTVIEVGNGALQVSLSWDQNDDLDLHLLEPDGNHIHYGNFSSESDRDFEFEFFLHIFKKYTQRNTSSIAYGDWDALDDYFDEYFSDSMWDRFERNYEEEWKLFLLDLDFDVGLLDLDSNPDCEIDGIRNENIAYRSEPPQGVYYVAVDLYSKCNMSKPGAKYSVTVEYNGQNVSISNKQIGQFEANDGGSNDDPSEYHVIGGFRINAQGITPVSVTSNPFENLDRYSLSAANKQKKAIKTFRK